ncbi:MAG: hydroxymethylbilane synthase [Gemmatales bacterium]|nr:hydroxymethylbilane synthase [Gemmatales bacterium]
MSESLNSAHVLSAAANQATPTTMTPLRLGTRGSALARWQAEHIADLLRPIVAPRTVELVIIRTTGDVLRDAPLARIGGTGVFTREIQQALLRGDVDLAVHSLKDLPTIPVPGLLLAAVPARGPANDVFISRKYPSLKAIPPAGRIATASLRRQALLKRLRPDLEIVPIRGNVETRLRKLDTENLDGLILAEAGLARLGLSHAITERLDVRNWTPAVGQGAIAVECRADDIATLEIVRQINHPATWLAVTAERAFLRRLGGGCQVPIAAHATIAGPHLTLHGMILSPDGSRCLEGTETATAPQAATIGEQLALRLLEQGAHELLQSPPSPAAPTPSSEE